MKDLDEATKEALSHMTKAQDMPRAERKDNMKRCGEQSVRRQTLPCRPNSACAVMMNGCLAFVPLEHYFKHGTVLSFLMKKKLRFSMLKQFMMKPDLSTITIEEKYQHWTENNRQDRFVTVPWCQGNCFVFSF